MPKTRPHDRSALNLTHRSKMKKKNRKGGLYDTSSHFPSMRVCGVRECLWLILGVDSRPENAQNAS